MTYKLLLPAAMSLALALPAMAATTDSSGSNTGSSASAQSGPAMATTPQISQKLRQSLTQAGYTSIQIVPQSFLVHAKDKGGNPVAMVVTPDSVTQVTELKGPAGSGSGSQAGASGVADQSTGMAHAPAGSAGASQTTKQ
jgi:hypothetical protein